MSYTVRDVCNLIDKLAPQELAFEWDNVGLQVGKLNQKVVGVLVTLTLTPEVLERAIKEKVDLIICHHPVIFRPISAIRTDQPQGALLASLLRHEIAVYVAHTNLDQATTGLNHWLARELGLEASKVLVPQNSDSVGLGRVGEISPTSLQDLANQLEALWSVSIRLVGDPTQLISTVAVVGGSGGDFVSQAKAAGADVLITGDVSYHDALDAQALGLAVLDAGHFATEKIMVQEIANYLRDHLGDQLNIISETSSNPFQ